MEIMANNSYLWDFFHNYLRSKQLLESPKEKPEFKAQSDQYSGDNSEKFRYLEASPSWENSSPKIRANDPDLAAHVRLDHGCWPQS